MAEAASGRWGRVVWATEASGHSSVRDFFYALADGDKAKVMALFLRMAEFGQIHNREKFKRVADDLWEFKAHQLRFFGDFRAGGMFVVAHAVRKKQDDLRRQDLEKARRILAEHDARAAS